MTLFLLVALLRSAGWIAQVVPPTGAKGDPIHVMLESRGGPPWDTIVPTACSVLAGLAGVGLGAWLSNRQAARAASALEEQRRQTDLRERLLALRELRVFIEAAEIEREQSASLATCPTLVDAVDLQTRARNTSIPDEHVQAAVDSARSLQEAWTVSGGQRNKSVIDARSRFVDAAGKLIAVIDSSIGQLNDTVRDL